MSHVHEDKKAKTSASPDVEDTESVDIEAIKKQCDDYLNGWKRAQADYQNLKKESDEKMIVLRKHMIKSIMSDLAPVLDALKKANTHIPEPAKKEAWAQGYAHIQSSFQDFFKQYGVSEIGTVGESFNHHKHEAIGKEAVEGKDPDIVIAVMSSGYAIDDTVLVPAKVIVSA